jgi:hypothetical protein
MAYGIVEIIVSPGFLPRKGIIARRAFSIVEIIVSLTFYLLKVSKPVGLLAL